MAVAPTAGTHQLVRLPPRADGAPALEAALWRPASAPGPFPALIVLHGSSFLGRRNGLVQMLAHYFQLRGWVVLTPDARGFGGSDDPPDIQNPASWRIENDIARWIAFLESHPEVRPGPVFMLGHSMGAGQALEGGLAHPRVQALVLLGPPLYSAQGAQNLWARIKFSSERDLPEPISKLVMVDRVQQTDIGSLVRKGQLAHARKPILVLDGSREKASKLERMQRLVPELPRSVTYMTIGQAGHYCGVYTLPISGRTYYRPEVLAATLKPVEAFLEPQLRLAQTAPPPPSP